MFIQQKLLVMYPKHNVHLDIIVQCGEGTKGIKVVGDDVVWMHTDLEKKKKHSKCGTEPAQRLSVQLDNKCAEHDTLMIL